MLIFQYIQKFLRDQFLRKCGADQCGKPDRCLNALHLVHFFRKSLNLLTAELAVHKHHVGGIHLKLFFQLCISHYTWQVLRK